MLDTEHITRAVASLAKWKSHLREAIETGTSDWTAAAIQLDDECELGQWLRSLPPEDRATAYWTEVRDRHRAVHVAAAEVLELALAGRGRDAETAMEHGDFAKASKQLTLAMTSWQEHLAPPACI
jgi:hypothetical protein